MQFDDNRLICGNEVRTLACKVNSVTEHEGFYYVLLQNWKLRIYKILNGKMKLVIKPRHEYGESILFYQNVMYAVSNPGYQLGSMTCVTFRHCHELRDKYPKQQCRHVKEELYGSDYRDSIFLDHIPILLTDGHDYINDKRHITLLNRKYGYSAGNSMNINHADKLFVYNGYLYAVGTDMKKYSDKQGPTEQHQLVCYIMLPVKDRLVIVDKLTSEPGCMYLRDPLNNVTFHTIGRLRNNWKYYEIEMKQYVACPNVTDKNHLCDIGIITIGTHNKNVMVND